MSAQSHQALRLRAFDGSADDYRARVRILNRVWTDYPTTTELLARADREDGADRPHRRLLAIEAGEAVAVCALVQALGAGNEGRFHLGVHVDPDARRRGIGGTCYDALMEDLEALGPDRLMTRTREDQGDALRFLDQRGFQSVLRNPMSRLDLTRFEPSGDGLRGPSVKGIRIASLADLMAEIPDWQVRCEALEWAIEQDIPMPEPPARLPMELYAKRFQHPSFRPDAWFFALDGDAWVGMTTLWPHPPTPDRLYTGVTGVLRSHRRRRIATALKLQAFRRAQTLGFREIETDNEESNPMLDLNLRFGFVEHPAWLLFLKRL